MIKVREIFIIMSIILLVGIAVIYSFWKPIIWSLIVVGPLVLIGYYDIFQKKHAIRRNFPVIGNMRYLFEFLRPEIMQYFVETDTEGRPIDRLLRTMIYERSKKENDTTPFGTQMDVYQTGYEWLNHSIYIKKEKGEIALLRVTVGGKQCSQPYSASILNISAMSFGSLSRNAVLAMNKGAKIGNFAQNTGEGGLSHYHKEAGGDLIWQIGTGYFGCRNLVGEFDPELFKQNASTKSVKMIEIKLSQGAKPGHGGILPASKNTKEIAAIRNVMPHTDVFSPPSHNTFDNAEGLMLFIQQLRELSDGKPVGFKLCVGDKEEFIDICKAMLATGILPDFITVDGGEGGTGAAPVEFSSSIGMPLLEGLAFVVNTLNGFSLKEEIKVIASGKIISGFHMARVFALGADMCNSARAMMMAVGCIQALQCNTNTCPTGVATQNESLIRGLDVNDKSVRVATFHSETVKAFTELLHATGLKKTSDLKRKHIFRRVEMNQIMSFKEIYPEVEVGSLVKSVPNFNQN
jgi:glutamate synthase domain-containing protein 2